MVHRHALDRVRSPVRLARLAHLVVVLVGALCLGGQIALADDGQGCASAKALLAGDLELRAIAEHLSANEPVRILAIGSSSTEGVGASSRANSYPSLLERQLRAAWSGGRIDVANSGIGGETADETLLRLERILAQPERPDLILWQVGTNDAVRGGDEARFRAMLERGLALARQAGSDLVLIDQQFFPRITDVPRYERYVGLVAKVGAEGKVSVFSRYALMKRLGEQDPNILAGMLAADGFHMGDQGYQCLATSIGRNLIDAVARNHETRAVARSRRVVPPGTEPTRRG